MGDDVGDRDEPGDLSFYLYFTFYEQYSLYGLFP